jgi:hypothetical protein
MRSGLGVRDGKTPHLVQRSGSADVDGAACGRERQAWPRISPVKPKSFAELPSASPLLQHLCA